jgi:hypothetical protein
MHLFVPHTNGTAIFKEEKTKQNGSNKTNLGRVLKHASSITLVLDLSTAHVFPQFHLEGDSLFEKLSLTRQKAQAHRSSGM